MTFTLQEIRCLLELIREKHGPGYAKDEAVARLQAKLSIWGQLAAERERRQPSTPDERRWFVRGAYWGATITLLLTAAFNLVVHGLMR